MSLTLPSNLISLATLEAEVLSGALTMSGVINELACAICDVSNPMILNTAIDDFLRAWNCESAAEG